MKGRIIRALLRIYSAAWRREYGAELRGILEARTLELRTIIDVAWNAAWQRIRATEPWLLLGCFGLILSSIFFGWLILVPPAYSSAFEVDGFAPSRIITALLVVMGCGFWTVVRSGGTLPHAGLQTMKMTLLAGVPFFVVWTLVATGVLDVFVLSPSDAPTTIAEHGFAIAWYDAEGAGPRLSLLMVGVAAGVLENWLWGALGGALGRLARRRLHPAG